MVWFESGSHVSTAARMRVHEHTIRNRIQRAEEAIGHPLTTRRTELQVALRLFQVVGR
jgi:DNA-binding PucR family transcriptional regulator